mgnify:CR=1 FL=1
MQKTLSVRCGAGCAAAQSYVFAKPMPVQRAVRGAFAQEGGQAHAPGCPAPGPRLRQRCNAKPAVFHVPAADPMTGPDAFRGQASTDGFCGLFGARLKIFFGSPKSCGEAVCKIRNAVYLKGYTAFVRKNKMFLRLIYLAGDVIERDAIWLPIVPPAAVTALAIIHAATTIAAATITFPIRS